MTYLECSTRYCNQHRKVIEEIVHNLSFSTASLRNTVHLIPGAFCHLGAKFAAVSRNSRNKVAFKGEVFDIAFVCTLSLVKIKFH